ncbi:hypothetical protein AURDEDRAFT_172898 [Auricularia subglabra TFB-10046 SS5]|nr:hypothetical protein AURDEDRAFT_172898 [Auricularia subglabra TFB-10046 SS5]
MACATKTNKHCFNACLSCRKKKKKCSGVGPICDTCMESGIKCVWETGRDRRTAEGRARELHDRIAQLEAQNAYLVALVGVLSPGFSELPDIADFPSQMSLLDGADVHSTLHPGGKLYASFDSFWSSPALGAPCTLRKGNADATHDPGAEDARCPMQPVGESCASSSSFSSDSDNVSTASTSAVPYTPSNEMPDTTYAPHIRTLAAHRNEVLPWHATPPRFTGDTAPEGSCFE